MAVDLQRQADGRLHFSLGPVERWIVGLVAAAVVGSVLMFSRAITSQLDNQGRQIAALAQQQAVTNSQLTQLTQQLSDIPGISRRQAEHAVRITRMEEDLRELQRTRGAR